MAFDIWYRCLLFLGKVFLRFIPAKKLLRDLWYKDHFFLELRILCSFLLDIDLMNILAMKTIFLTFRDIDLKIKTMAGKIIIWCNIGAL